eukprot:COSAG01_NODE_7450_length_3207_cov_2.139961_1_plen_855_part_10
MVMTGNMPRLVSMLQAHAPAETMVLKLSSCTTDGELQCSLGETVTTRFEMTETTDKFEVPNTGVYTITAAGASAPGGKGAVVKASFWLSGGTSLSLLVGGMPERQDGAPCGGAGGTFVVCSGEPLLVAGGAGGPGGRGGVPSRPKRGDRVKLRHGASPQGVLEGDGTVGTIIEDDRSSVPFKVEYDGDTYWYSEKSLEVDTFDTSTSVYSVPATQNASLNISSRSESIDRWQPQFGSQEGCGGGGMHDQGVPARDGGGAAFVEGGVRRGTAGFGGGGMGKKLTQQETQVRPAGKFTFKGPTAKLTEKLDFGGGGGGGYRGGKGGPCGEGGGSFCHPDGFDVSTQHNSDDQHGHVVIQAITRGEFAVEVDEKTGTIRCKGKSSVAEQCQLQGCFVAGIRDSHGTCKMVQDYGLSAVLHEVRGAHPEGKMLLLRRRSAEATTPESLVRHGHTCTISRVDSSLLVPTSGKQAAAWIDEDGRTALHWAVERKAPEAVVKQLLDLAPSSVNVRDCKGMQPGQLGQGVLLDTLKENQAAIVLQSVLRRAGRWWPLSAHLSDLERGMVNHVPTITATRAFPSEDAARNFEACKAFNMEKVKLFLKSNIDTVRGTEDAVRRKNRNHAAGTDVRWVRLTQSDRSDSCWIWHYIEDSETWPTSRVQFRYRRLHRSEDWESWRQGNNVGSGWWRSNAWRLNNDEFEHAVFVDGNMAGLIQTPTMIKDPEERPSASFAKPNNADDDDRSLRSDNLESMRQRCVPPLRFYRQPVSSSSAKLTPWLLMKLRHFSAVIIQRQVRRSQATAPLDCPHPTTPSWSILPRQFSAFSPQSALRIPSPHRNPSESAPNEEQTGILTLPGGHSCG